MPSARRGPTELEQPEGNNPGINAPGVANQWELLSSRWFNLPAALLIGLIALATVVPPPSVDLPALSMPWSDSSDDDPANLAALDPSPIAIGTPVKSATPAGQLAAGPVGPEAVADTAGGVTSDLVTSATVRPNELGGVPVIMYHAFTTNPKYLDEWTLMLDQFREQLDWYREHDFVMVGVQSMIDGHFDVPAGKTPIILTFDDGTAGQFGLQAAPGGGYEVNPDTAVGVLEAYAEAYPEFAGPAFFGIHPWNCFASDDDPSTCEERLTWLIDHGYEVGNHTADHVELTDVSDAFFTNSIAAMIDWINERVPEGPGNLSHALVMPFGAYPDPDLHPDQRAWLAEGFWYEGEPVNLDVVFAVSGGPAIPLYSLEADPSYTYRIASYPEILEPWQDSVRSGDADLFISDGDPGAVTVPADRIDELDEVWCKQKGLEVRTYDASGA